MKLGIVWIVIGLAVGSALAKDAPILSRTALQDYVATWPESLSNKVTRKVPIHFKKWNEPYARKSGEAIVDQINAWFKEGTAAGLTQDTFRSFDSDHSKVPAAIYPQMTFAKAVADYRPATETIYSDRVTFGVQSLGFHESPFNDRLAIPEFHERCQILQVLNPAHLKKTTGLAEPIGDPALYHSFYESNCLLVRPAVWNYEIRPDGQHLDDLSFLTPFCLYSIGNSGSDAHLIKPIIYAAAALPPSLKTRMLQSGTYTPSLLGLFKKQIGGGTLLTTTAHPSAYKLPAERDGAPFLRGLVTQAHGLKHIPPITRMTITQEPTWHGTKPGFIRHYEYLCTAALREGESLELEIDLEKSWLDGGQTLKSAHAMILREPNSTATLKAKLMQMLVNFTDRHPLVIEQRRKIKAAEGAGSTLIKVKGYPARWRLKVSWQAATPLKGLKRTDVLFTVNDGTYDGAPAYISVRHLQPAEKWLGR